MAGPRCRAGVPLITGPPRPAVPMAAPAPSRGGCRPWCTAPSAALAAELVQAATGSATRRGRSEYRPGAHAAGHRRRQMAAWRGTSGHAGDRAGAPMGDRGRPSQGRVLRAVALQGSSGRATWRRGGRHVFPLTGSPWPSSCGWSWTGWWTGAPGNPGAVSAISAIIRVIWAASASYMGSCSDNPSAVGPSLTRPEAAGHDFGRLKAILLTHAHWDHMSGMPDFPGLPIIAVVWDLGRGKAVSRLSGRLCPTRRCPVRRRRTPTRRRGSPPGECL